jgi:GNAT superfamily N-acetyltransferase
LPHIGDYFGDRAIELAGIIVHPDIQKHRFGTQLVSKFIAEERPSRIIAYTRNPALLRAVGNACDRADVLDYTDSEVLAATIPHATVEEDGYVYHAGRYAPDGLYGTFDPAIRNYQGVPLNERCRVLRDEVNALAISAETGVR